MTLKTPPPMGICVTFKNNYSFNIQLLHFMRNGGYQRFIYRRVSALSHPSRAVYVYIHVVLTYTCSLNIL